MGFHRRSSETIALLLQRWPAEVIGARTSVGTGIRLSVAISV
jgi:hypothetical protein